jgi:hypothetical protein
MFATPCSDTGMENCSPIIESFSAVIDAFGGAGQFGEAIGIPDSHARTMKARDSIPAARWNSVVEAADRLKIDGISFKLLADLEEARAKSKKPETEGAGQ